MTCSKNIFSFFLSLGLLLVSSSALAEPTPAATTLFTQGTVTAQSTAMGERALQKSDPVYESDRINTHTDGRAQLRFSDGGLVSLMPDTLFTVEEYFYEGEDDGALVFGLLKGGLRTITGALGKTRHEQYELKTPVATLGIRGTEYIAVLEPPNTLRVHVGRGKVVLTNDQGELEVPMGRSAIAVAGQAPAFSDEAPEFNVDSGPLPEHPRFTDLEDPMLADPLRDFPELDFEHLQAITPEVPDVPEPPIVDPELPEFCLEYPEEC